MKKVFAMVLVIMAYLIITACQVMVFNHDETIHDRIGSKALLSNGIPTVAWVKDINAGGYIDGASIGGFGAGTITLRFDGNFYRGRLNISESNMTVDTSCNFYIYQKPSGQSAVFKKLNAATLGSGQANYYSLFPVSWVDYYGSAFTAKVKVKQFSPIIPGDYQRTSYPVGIYVWSISNPTSSPCDVAIMLTWNNNFSGSTAAAFVSNNNKGIILQRSGTSAAAEKNQGEFTLASQEQTGVSVTYESATAVSTLENDFSTNGTLKNSTGSHTNGAVAFKVTLAAGQSINIPIVLAWDIPIVQLGNKWYREYTRYFSRSGLNSSAIANEALNNYTAWQSSVDSWQNNIINSSVYPDWLKTTLFNELYYYFVGGTIWEAGAASGQADNASEDMFSHMECYDYAFYGTSDVRFYGSWPLALLWPNLDKQAVKQFSDSIYNNRSDRPAALGTCAHDFGTTNNVFTIWNAYTYRDSTTWKDLNSKFVLMVYRDYVLTGKSDTTFLNYCWTSVKTAMTKVKGQDTDSDGLPNSTGIDQTYDDMSLSGNTAYCGSLFLAACLAAKQIALAMGDSSTASTYQSWYDQGKASFESKLWNGSYYNIDTGSSATNRIMSDQLCGEWYAKALGLGNILDSSHISSAFTVIYQNNFKKFDSGTHGVVNVMTSSGSIDSTSSQTREMWVGTAWGVTAGMIQEGLTSQASEIGNSLYSTIYLNNQLYFRTPEAWQSGVSSIRAYYYMRANAVWAVKYAYDNAGTPASSSSSISSSVISSAASSTAVSSSLSSAASSTAVSSSRSSVASSVAVSSSRSSVASSVAVSSSRAASSAAASVASSTAASSGGGYAVNYTVNNDWGAGATCTVTVKNNSATAVNGWTLVWTFAGNQTLTQIWNAAYTASGETITVTNASFNNVIGANGGTQSFGFNLSYSGSNAKPASFTLNGTACSVY